MKAESTSQKNKPDFWLSLMVRPGTGSVALEIEEDKSLDRELAENRDPNGRRSLDSGLFPTFESGMRLSFQDVTYLVSAIACHSCVHDCMLLLHAYGREK